MHKSLAIIVLLTFMLFEGCTTTQTKIVEVPVPIPCAKPAALPKPHNYLAELKPTAGAKEFVPACLMTTESYKNAYDACFSAIIIK